MSEDESTLGMYVILYMASSKMVMFVRVPLVGRINSRVRNSEEAKVESKMSKEARIIMMLRLDC